MKSKAPLALMEQLVMLVTFSLAAAVCLQLFIFSDRVSRQCEARDNAVAAVQSAAEGIKACRGDLSLAQEQFGGSYDGHCWQQHYDAGWLPTQANSVVYTVTVLPTAAESPLIGCATVEARDSDGQLLFSINVAWQEGMK